MLATRSNWRDVQKYYQSTYVKFKELGEHPAFIEKVTDQAIWASLFSGEKVELQLCEEGYNLDYCIPKKTVYQQGNRACILERIPARMWKKGLNEENTMISLILHDGEFDRISVNFGRVFEYVNKPMYGSLNDVEEHGFESVALNSRFYACANRFIYADLQTTGMFTPEKVHYHKCFEKEFKKMFEGSSRKLVGV